MAQILTVIVIYLLVYGADHAFYMKQKSKYAYVSRRTLGLFLAGLASIIGLHYPVLSDLVVDIGTEISMVLVLFAMLLGFSTALYSQRELVCNIISRTERCLTPGYVVIRSVDIIFQQLCYFVLAKGHEELVGTGVLGYLSFTIALLLIHTPLIFSTNRDLLMIMTVGTAIFAVPFFYVYTSLGLLWPAVYLHALAYVFLWLGLANWDGPPRYVQKWGKEG